MASSPVPTKGSSEGPPFFKNWSGMYFLVLGGLLGTILLFAFVSAVYR